MDTPTELLGTRECKRHGIEYIDTGRIAEGACTAVTPHFSSTHSMSFFSAASSSGVKSFLMPQYFRKSSRD